MPFPFRYDVLARFARSLLPYTATGRAGRVADADRHLPCRGHLTRQANGLHHAVLVAARHPGLCERSSRPVDRTTSR